MVSTGDRIVLLTPLEAVKDAPSIPAGRWGTVTHVFGPDGVIAWFGEEHNGSRQGRIVRRGQYQEQERSTTHA